MISVARRNVELRKENAIIEGKNQLIVNILSPINNYISKNVKNIKIKKKSK